LLGGAKLQWLQDPSEINEDNLNHIRLETREHIRNKMMECLKDKIERLQ
jgi:Fe-S cluster biosynthesis and repair protein YggX